MTLIDPIGFPFSPEFAIAEALYGRCDRTPEQRKEIEDLPWEEKRTLALEAAALLGWMEQPWID